MKLVDIEAFADQGRRAYRFGIENYNNPLKQPNERKAWNDGWVKERNRDPQRKREEANHAKSITRR